MGDECIAKLCVFEGTGPDELEIDVSVAKCRFVVKFRAADRVDVGGGTFRLTQGDDLFLVPELVVYGDTRGDLELSGNAQMRARLENRVVQIAKQIVIFVVKNLFKQRKRLGKVGGAPIGACN